MPLYGYTVVSLSVHLLKGHLGYIQFAAAAAKSLQSCPVLCDPIDGSPPGSPVPGILRQEHWSGLPFSSPMHENEKWKWSRSVVSDSVQPHRQQPTRLPRLWDSQARTLEWVAISFCNAWKWKVKVKLLSHVWPSMTPWTAGSSVHGIFQARVLSSLTLISFYFEI